MDETMDNTVDEEMIESENMADTAQPPESETTAGENEQSAADSEHIDQNSQQQPQSKEQNAAFAAARRRAEQERDAAIARVRSQAQSQMDDFVAGLGITDPYTGKAIKTRAEYEQYRVVHAERQRDQFMETAGMTREQYDQFIQSLPEVQEANRTRQQAQAAQQEAEHQQARAALEEEMGKITAQDPAIRSIEDLMEQENYGQIYTMVKQGYKLSDAYKLANFDTIAQKTAAAAAQKTRNNTSGKNHMSQTMARGEGAAEVPPEIRQEYLALNPRASDDQIRKHYAKYAKR